MARRGQAPAEQARRSETASTATADLEPESGSLAPLDPWFAALARVVPLGVVAFDSNGAPVRANRIAYELLGLGAVDDSMVALEKLGSLLAPHLARLGHGSAGGAEIAVELADGGRRLELRPVAVEGVGSVGGSLVLVEDSTRRTAHEASLLLASRTRSASALRQQVHDLKAPLNSLALNVELLKRSVAGHRESAPEACEEELALAEVLRKEIARLGRLLDAFLEQALEPEPTERGARRTDLRRTVREIVRLVRPSAASAAVRLRLELPPQPVEVHVDRDRVKQALLNLVLNALEAQPDGGEIRLRIDVGSGDVRLAVEDDGPGIPEHLRERVLELDFTTKADGHGLGLTVARSVVESQGGRLEFDESPSGGATVAVYLPALDADPPS